MIGEPAAAVHATSHRGVAEPRPEQRIRLLGKDSGWPMIRPILLGALAQLSAVGLMALSGWLLSRAAQHPPVLYLMSAIVAVRALGIGRGVFRYRERIAGHDVALRWQAKLRLRVFERLADGRPLRRGGDLLARVLADVDAVQDLVVRVMVPVASTAIVIIAASAAITFISWPAGVLLLVGSVLSGVLVPLLIARGSAAATASMAPLRAELADQVDEVARARQGLVANGADAAALGRLSTVSRRLAAAERRAAYWSGLAGGLQWSITGLVIVGSLLIGGSAVVDHGLDPVYLAVFALTPLALHEVVAQLPVTAQTWLRTRTSLHRVAALLSRPLTRSTGTRTATAADSEIALQVKDLTVGWPGTAAVVAGFELTLRRGERVALIGPSGRGKSTIAQTIMGFLPPVAGSILVPHRLGYLAQDAHLFDTTVAENVRIGAKDASDAEVRAALTSVGLDFDLDRQVGEYGAAISGGEARRLALARLEVSRSCAGDFDLLIMDEPTEHLDRNNAEAITELVMTVPARTAVLVITHDPRLMSCCDRVVHL
ncbi:thiol reductant ABC exporter subunit CydC [Microlunatus elymi]|uniref:Thiol reductant ABC exporter subunit CydC n=1 Tax=Microlunatus elymi TaxID=2596828 RepID=A0A516PU63_9ACTN|nr:thiol reductant ABC exporter subunit CydC [Microlunatus elymi]QDP94683.1 thiol reductant ABC exporter subunit CydC [Microlunatus elymi]